ncbi:MAG TPA: protein translocase subunit SecF [Bryobacteraceae bacterium]|nr:protein translocase subunit SecF [Bryobacteraceae bacterium]
MKGGPLYGIDFTGGSEVRLAFSSEPPVEKIRAALSKNIPGEISVQQITGQNQIIIGTEVKSDKDLNTSRNEIETTLRGMFGDSNGKLDLNNSSVAALADALRSPLLQAGASLSEDQLQALSKSIENYRASNGGIIHSFDQLSAVPGVTPQVLNTLKQQTVLGPFTILSVNVIGPKVGSELRQQAILATLYALGGMLVYIAFRFEWIYGAAAVVAVFHDTIITIGLFSLTNQSISLTVVAALLTLVGYSMNDTIVVFDRIRENLKILRREKLEHLINISVNQTLSRTVLTSGLTLLTALSLWIFGGEVLRGFSFALVVGIIVGTYSSVFIASPILVFWQNFIESRKKAAPPPVKGAPPAAADKEAKPAQPKGPSRPKQAAGGRKAMRG